MREVVLVHNTQRTTGFWFVLVLVLVLEFEMR